MVLRLYHLPILLAMAGGPRRRLLVRAVRFSVGFMVWTLGEELAGFPDWRGSVRLRTSEEFVPSFLCRNGPRFPGVSGNCVVRDRSGGAGRPGRSHECAW